MPQQASRAGPRAPAGAAPPAASRSGAALRAGRPRSGGERCVGRVEGRGGQMRACLPPPPQPQQQRGAAGSPGRCSPGSSFLHYPPHATQTATKLALLMPTRWPNLAGFALAWRGAAALAAGAPQGAAGSSRSQQRGRLEEAVAVLTLLIMLSILVVQLHRPVWAAECSCVSRPPAALGGCRHLGCQWPLAPGPSSPARAAHVVVSLEEQRAGSRLLRKGEAPSTASCWGRRVGEIWCRVGQLNTCPRRSVVQRAARSPSTCACCSGATLPPLSGRGLAPFPVPPGIAGRA